MTEIPGFWDVGPHEPLAIETAWDGFISSACGKGVGDVLSKSPNFDNPDYLFENARTVLELKEVETEFLRSGAFILPLSGWLPDCVGTTAWQRQRRRYRWR